MTNTNTKEVKILCATSNKNKIKEYERLFLLHGLKVKCIPLSKEWNFTEPSENKKTLSENADFKCIDYSLQMFMMLQRQNIFLKDYCDYIIAEDFGFNIPKYPHITGEGVYSKRILERNNVLGHYENTDEGRNQYIVDVYSNDECEYISQISVLNTNKPHTKVFEGKCKGVVAENIKGEHGFAFDKIFLLENEKTLAEMGDSIKDCLSSRSMAIKAICEDIKKGGM